MMKEKLSLLLAVFLITGSSLSGVNIAWVSFHAADDAPSANAATAGFTTAPDAGYTALLRSKGHNVTRFVTIGDIQNNPDLIAALNTNDLVIVSRSVPSGHYDSVDEVAAWQGLTVPLLSLNGYIDRANRLGFHTGDTIPDVNSSEMRLHVNDPTHPIFTGVALDADNLMVNPYAQLVTYTNLTQRGISVVTSEIINGGTILATVGTTGDAAINGMVIGEFPAGITCQRGSVLAAKRLVCLTGSREQTITSEGAGIFDLMPDGEKLFLNAVTYLTSPPNIAWVSFHAADDTPSANAATAGFTNAPDAGYTALLRSKGYNVTRFVTIGDIQNNPDLIAALNTNDLVIVSRSVPSGHYDSVDEVAAWQGLTVPLMSLNGYIDRANRLGFHTGDTIPDVNSSELRLRVNAPTHPIFAGVALDVDNLMVNPYAQLVTYTNLTQRGISVVTSGIINGGTILATVGTAGDAATNGMVIGEFPAGITCQRGSVLAAKRLVCLTGSREQSITSEGAGIFDLMPDGETLFLNAVQYLISAQDPKCTTALVGATNLMAGDTWTFRAGVIGDQPLTYQWYKDGSPLSEGTNATLAFAPLTTADAGAYYLIVTNIAGSATSTVARLDFAEFASASITNALISYWPLNTVDGTKTPDLVSGYDLNLVKMDVTNVVPGKWGNAFQFDNATQTLLARTHNPGEDLPIYQHPDFTVSAWVMGTLQSDHRVYCESSTTNNNPMFDFGTHNTGADATVDIFIRTDGGTATSDHRHSTAAAFDYSWHNIVYSQRDVGNGIMKAQLWVDGVLDPVAIDPGRPLTANTTAIGGVRRASDSAWFTGWIDEVAVWNRALSPAEIAILQTTYITNPPSRLQPLAINRFKADLPAVASGDSTVLRWDVSKDATQVTIDLLGDVTANTSVGIGSTSITLTQSLTYVLTIKRGTDSLSATTSVVVVEGIAPGWSLLDNFDQTPLGNLFANGYWKDVSGNSAQVVSVNDNRAIRNSTAGSIVYLGLGDLTVTERQARTLFFRVIAGADNASGITNIVGLTDKSQRSYGDEYQNIGPVLYVAPFTNDFIGATTNAWYLGARNGFAGNNTSNPIDYKDPALGSSIVYNVWIDITNGPISEWALDSFTVYIQKEGETSRTVLFQDYLSDRDIYYIDPVLGGFLPDLDKLVVLGNNATYSVLLDDFYLSKGGYNATVPRPYGFTGPVGPLPALHIGWSGSQLEIRWTQGTLQEASTINGEWTNVTDATPPSHLVTPSDGAKFYRARQ